MSMTFIAQLEKSLATKSLTVDVLSEQLSTFLKQPQTNARLRITSIDL